MKKLTCILALLLLCTAGGRKKERIEEPQKGAVLQMGFNEGPGAKDWSNSGNNGIVTNAVWSTVNGYSGGGYYLGGAAYIKTPHVGAREVIGSLSMWINSDYVSSVSKWLYIFDSDTYRLAFYKYSGQNAIHMYIDGRERGFAVSWAANTWHHIVFLWDKSADKQELYLDNVAASVNSVGGTWGSNTFGTYLYIGAATGGGAPWEGKIDEVQMFDHVISTVKITQLYEQGKANKNP